MEEIQFHRSDMCLIQGDKCAKFKTAEGVVFYNLWSRKGAWVTIDDILTGLDGRKVPSVDPKKLVASHMSSLRKLLREAKIDIAIEVQHQSFWADSAYRIP